MMVKPALHSAALLFLLLLCPGTLTADNDVATIEVQVKNSLLSTPPLIYSTSVAFRGILLGAMNRLMNSNADFKFTYTQDPNYGPYLESVNGLAGSQKDHTYWELLVQLPNKTIIRPDVGIGCYIPGKNEKIILNFTKW
ncbi:transcobalamin beta a [Limanda limanda]|uniref:transcobalamin beta a n=1 Tax=Limanda limanda TaxID=27771 RepID=UPI0029C6CE35|nr:transcobalamin beta a [Limanda limanda]